MNYYDLGEKKQLNQIIMAGSHDAAITQGSVNAKTQSINIHGQATAGVRLFDLRITGQIVGGKDQKVMELTAYHGTPSKVKITTSGKDVANVTAANNMKLGTWGMELKEILTQAKDFVKGNPSEFLLLKFDKCDNWQQIAEMCVEILGDYLYMVPGNLNVTEQKRLKSKVVVLFTPKGYDQVHNRPEVTKEVLLGIHQIKNLYGSGKVYQQTFDGLQYWGKGGTSPVTFGTKRSIDENIKKQKKILSAAIDQKPSSYLDVMGMMYWTTTGVIGNIEERTKEMWKAKYTEKMVELWRAIRDHAGTDTVAETSVKKVQKGQEEKDQYFRVWTAREKQFLPNFIMTDFADSDKCNTIFKLNGLTPSDFQELQQL